MKTKEKKVTKKTALSKTKEVIKKAKEKGLAVVARDRSGLFGRNGAVFGKESKMTEAEIKIAIEAIKSIGSQKEPGFIAIFKTKEEKDGVRANGFVFGHKVPKHLIGRMIDKAVGQQDPISQLLSTLGR